MSKGISVKKHFHGDLMVGSMHNDVIIPVDCRLLSYFCTHCFQMACSAERRLGKYAIFGPTQLASGIFFQEPCRLPLSGRTLPLLILGIGLEGLHAHEGTPALQTVLCRCLRPPSDLVVWPYVF